MPFEWEDCIAEGDDYFNYMVAHFDSMCKEDSIPHFTIGYAWYSVMAYYDIVKMDHMDALLPFLISFLKEEATTRRLFDHSHWRPCRDKYDISPIYLGYDKLFVYKQYYFQVAVNDQCKKCSERDVLAMENLQDHQDPVDSQSTYAYLHFELELFGWTEETEETEDTSDSILLKPIDVTIVHQLIPESFWDTE